MVFWVAVSGFGNSVEGGSWPRRVKSDDADEVYLWGKRVSVGVSFVRGGYAGVVRDFCLASLLVRVSTF